MVKNKPSGANEHRYSLNYIERSYDYLKTFRTAKGFRFAQGEEESLIGTCCGIFILEGLQRLDTLTGEEHKAIASYILECQEQSSGFFVDPLDDSTVKDDSEFSISHKKQRSTYFALQALDILGLRAKYTLKFADKYIEKRELTKVLESMDWARLGFYSDLIMFLMFFLIYKTEVELNSRTGLAFHNVLDWLDQTQQENTGFWGDVNKLSPYTFLSISYRFLPFFEYVHRPIKRKKRMIDFALHLQQTDGGFGRSGYEYEMENLAAIHLLSSFTGEVSYRRDDITDVLLRAHKRITESDSQGCLSHQKGKIESKSFTLDRLDGSKSNQHARSLWPILLNLISTAIISSRCPNKIDDPINWTFRKWPAIGYYRPTDSLTEREHRVLRLWFRPFDSSIPASNRFSRTRPATSVIIPCHNLGRYLPEAVESVLSQTNDEFEIIIVDDGSTDEFTKYLVSNLDYPKTTVVRQENKGLGSARNTGIRNSSGSYISCLDADDRLKPRFIEKAKRCLDSDPKLGFVSGYWKKFDEADDACKYDKCEFPDILVFNPVMIPSLFRRTVWEKIGGFYEGFSSSGIEDWDFWISALELGFHSYVIREIAYEYRIRADSMSEDMSRPVKWEKLMKELASRHVDIYGRYIVEVVAENGRNQAMLSEWIKERNNAIAWLTDKSLKQESWIRRIEKESSRLKESKWYRLGRRMGFMKHFDNNS